MTYICRSSCIYICVWPHIFANIFISMWVYDLRNWISPTTQLLRENEISLRGHILYFILTFQAVSPLVLTINFLSPQSSTNIPYLANSIKKYYHDHSLGFIQVCTLVCLDLFTDNLVRFKNFIVCCRNLVNFIAI